jgi:DNA-binding Lrp family transcriptional regulator
MSEYSEAAPDKAIQMNDVRPLSDDTDRRILDVLAAEARIIPHNALADRVGIAPSTCLGRVRALVKRGVIRGFYADIDPEAVRHCLQAIIARISVGTRHHPERSRETDLCRARHRSA